MFTFLLRSARVLLVAAALGASVRVPAETFTQPVAPVRPATDNYFGTIVTDNYRWMEDLKSPEVQKWMTGQAAYTKDYLSKLPGRDALVKRIESLDNAAIQVPEVELRGAYYFYLKTNPTDQTPKLYVRAGLHATERLLVDSQLLGGPKERFTISAFYPSPDGRFVAVEIAAGGSEEGVVHVLDVATGKPLNDKIDRVWESSVSWVSSEKRFFYTRLQKLGPGMTELDKELNMTAYLHRLGDNPERDTPVLGSKFDPPVPMLPTDSGFVAVQPDSHYGFGTIFHGVQNEITLVCSPIEALMQGKPSWTKICDVDDGVVGFDVRGNDLFLRTHKDAPRFKIIHVDLQHPDIAKADVVVPQSDLVLRNVGTAEDALYVQAAQTGIGRVLRVVYGQSESQQIQLPFVGAVDAFATNPQADGVLLRLAGWVEAPRWYAYDPGTNQVTDTGLEPQNSADFSGITAVEVTAPGADGTPIPLSVIYKKDLKMDGSNPCLMEGYGSYGITIDPEFDSTQLALLERGTVIAWAHVRGGGESGEDWHLAGQMQTKQNTISDFIACAKYLIKQGYTSSSKLALRGTSAGGITIGGALTERPDLFTLAIVNVGVVNALRAEAEPNGAVNTPEFGSVNDPDGFKALYAMDAYQHVKEGTPYPAVLLITGANDPRVDPVELFKMTARLQAATSSKNPVLLRVDSDAGHGIGSSKQQRELITADQATLLLSLAAKSKS